MSELQEIEATLSRAEKRRRWAAAFRGLWQGLLVGAGIWCLTLGIHKVFPTPQWTLTTAAVIAGLAVLGWTVASGWRRHTVGETARWVDGKQHLQERLSTALEMAKAGGEESWRQLLVSDAAAHVKNLKVEELAQFRAPRSSKWAFVLVVLGIGLWFVPAYRTTAFVQKQNDQKVIKESGQRLVELTKHSLSNRPPTLETTEKSLEAVSGLGEEMTKRIMTKTEALKDLANLSQKLKDEFKDIAKDPALQRMQQAAHSGGNDSQDNMQQQMDAMKKQLGDNKASPEDMDKMANDLEKLQEQAKSEMDQNGSLSQSTKEKLAQSLAAMSKQSQDMGMNLPDLDQAIQALAASQPGLFTQDMKSSLNDLQKMRDLAKSLQQMQKQQAEQMGKDLAEQLQNGQAQTAQKTLQKMIDQLKNGDLSQEQANQMLAEVSKAVDPGSKYGKVGEHLKQAAQQLSQGQKPGAAQSLAEASKELDKLMQQMGDAQSLMAELDALDKAQMALCNGNCDGWGLTSKRPGKMGKGGKPGSGVGTWADENGGWGYDGQNTGLWDNSGLTRPDMAAKGLTDRPTDLNEDLKPTQLNGKMSPGGPMPSIPLKNVSIRGMSKVELIQAAAAAQEDSQAPSSQDRIPRAYKDSVRDYFDDVKK